MKHYDKDWYNKGCRTLPIIKDENYIDIDTHIHDSKIILAKISTDNSNDFIIEFDRESSDCTYNEMKFVNSKILEECNVVGKWCIADEIYKTPNGYEYHLLLQSFKVKSGTSILEYFTIRCKELIVKTDDNSLKLL